uniref:Prefoldin subunit 1 n=1 Tax=Clastoptera arizonana TaxID=38151 RepID=A0A1B6C0C2_9HEMI
MSRAVDLELKKAFAALQNKVLMTHRQLKVDDHQIELYKKKRHHLELIKGEVNALTRKVKIYQGFGRMFLLSDFNEVLHDLDTKSNTLEEKIKSVQNNKAFLERSLKDSENNLREMVQQKKDAL